MIHYTVIAAQLWLLAIISFAYKEVGKIGLAIIIYQSAEFVRKTCHFINFVQNGLWVKLHVVVVCIIINISAS